MRLLACSRTLSISSLICALHVRTLMSSLSEASSIAFFISSKFSGLAFLTFVIALRMARIDCCSCRFRASSLSAASRCAAISAARRANSSSCLFLLSSSILLRFSSSSLCLASSSALALRSCLSFSIFCLPCSRPLSASCLRSFIWLPQFGSSLSRVSLSSFCSASQVSVVASLIFWIIFLIASLAFISVWESTGFGVSSGFGFGISFASPPAPEMATEASIGPSGGTFQPLMHGKCDFRSGLWAQTWSPPTSGPNHQPLFFGPSRSSQK
mmetsp:Transcript_86070/g.221626  ORF Transcript_86070/g.221626 Transcript_86070/m.221626 type:complete len:270 (+) Transcript_86070:2218-3027(+)